MDLNDLVPLVEGWEVEVEEVEEEEEEKVDLRRVSAYGKA